MEQRKEPGRGRKEKVDADIFTPLAKDANKKPPCLSVLSCYLLAWRAC